MPEFNTEVEAANKAFVKVGYNFNSVDGFWESGSDAFAYIKLISSTLGQTTIDLTLEAAEKLANNLLLRVNETKKGKPKKTARRELWDKAPVGSLIVPNNGTSYMRYVKIGHNAYVLSVSAASPPQTSLKVLNEANFGESWALENG